MQAESGGSQATALAEGELGEVVVAEARLRVHPDRRVAGTAWHSHRKLPFLGQRSGNAAADLPRLTPCLRYPGLGHWYQYEGSIGSSGPLQRNHHLGHLFPCSAQYAGQIGRSGGERTEALVQILRHLLSMDCL